MKQIQTLVTAVIAMFAALAEKVLQQAFAYTGNRGLMLFVNLYSQYTYDANLLLKAAAAVAATANGTLELDVGNGLLDADLVIDVTALEIDSNDESYEIVVQGSTVSGFGTATAITALASVTLGDKASTRLAAGVLAMGTDGAIGRYVLPFRNEQNGTIYRYLRIKTIVNGTVATGINYSAFVAKK